MKPITRLRPDQEVAPLMAGAYPRPSFWAVYFSYPIYRVGRWIKNLALVILGAFIMGLAITGAWACYIAWQYQGGFIQAYVMDSGEYVYYAKTQAAPVEDLPIKKGKK